MNPKISIIVPVYNNTKLIVRCVNSLINQTYENIEIVLVNDGSTDDTLLKLKELKKLDKRIVVLNQQNMGAGEARNNGIKNCKGEYITFVDSDDSLEKVAIEDFVSILEDDTDIIISGLRRIDNNKTVFKMIPKDKIWSEFKFTATHFKLYKKSFLLNNNIFYKKYRIAEDVVFCLTAYSKTNNIKILSKDNYLYYSNPHSLTTSVINDGKKYEIGEVLEALYSIDFTKYNSELIKYFFVKMIVQNVIMQLNSFSTKELNEIYLNNYIWFKKNVNNNKNMKIHFQKGETFLINSIINTFILFTNLKQSKLLIATLKKCRFIRIK